jgi:L-threonylcarbamoyladenylate synthase
MRTNIRKEVELCAKTLNDGGLILYPTDTIWGIGCDAANETAIDKVFKLKQRAESKSLIVLLADIKDIANYVGDADDKILDYISNASHPVTAIYEDGKNVAANLLNKDGTIAIRIVRDAFCATLINKLKKPLVSTSANVSGEDAPANFSDINSKIKNGVDYIVQHRQGDFRVAKPSEIIRLNKGKDIEVIRS